MKKTMIICGIAVAFYTSRPIINEDKISSKRLIYITSKRENDLENPRTIAAIVHEMAHLIKSYKNEYSYTPEGSIIERTGLSSFELTEEHTDRPKDVKGLAKNIGLEEAINCYDEAQITSLITGEPYTTIQYYHLLDPAIAPLLEDEKVRKTIAHDQIIGGNEIEKVLGKDNFEKLSNSFQDVYYPFVAPFTSDRSVRLGIRDKKDAALVDIEQQIKEYEKSKIKNDGKEQVLNTNKEKMILTKKDIAIADRDNEITESEVSDAKNVLTKIKEKDNDKGIEPEDE